MRARIIEDSLHSESEIRLTTVLVEDFPKGLGLQDERTHRAGAFSVESSRAITATNYRARDFYVPEFLSNRGGMVPGEPVAEQELCEQAWLKHIQSARELSVFLEEHGVHKDLCNAGLDFAAPISWVMTLDHHGWQNLLRQRCAKDVRPQIRELNCQIYEQWIAATPKTVRPEGLHLPFVEDHEHQGYSYMDLLLASAARCARVSTGRHFEQRAILIEAQQGEKLARDRHWSPLEHPCKALSAKSVDLVWRIAFRNRDKSVFGPFDPSWQQLRKIYSDEHGSIRGAWDSSWRL